MNNMGRLRVATVSRPDDPVSLRVYESNMVRELAALDLKIELFPEDGPIPKMCDVVWDPSLCMRRISPIILRTKLPVVGTVHGVKAFSLPLEELTRNEAEKMELLKLKHDLLQDWSWLRERAAAVVAVSRYAAQEVLHAFDLPVSMVHVVHNGIDHEIFTPNGALTEDGQTYFLHVSSDNPIKNVERILAAHAQIAECERPELIAVLPGLVPNACYKDVRVVRHELRQTELASLYRGALCLVFPSLRETFGMPVVEAMACGCPVITSNSTGCAEIAGDAALLVDPRSVEQITAAMLSVSQDADLREHLRVKGIRRSRDFSWRRSAEKFVEILECVG